MRITKKQQFTGDKISRRQMLKGATLALAVPWIIPASALGKDGRPAPSERLVVASIGTGGQGTQNMKGFCSFDQVQLVAVCDVDRSRREEAKQYVDGLYGNNDCAAYNDFREIIHRPDIDITVISTPDHWHVIPAIEAMRHGKDVYVEKPLTLTLAEGKAIVEAAARYGSVTQVGSWQRSIHRFLYAADIVRSGALGKIELVKVGLPVGASQGVQAEEPVPDGFDYNFWLGQAPMAPYSASRCHSAFRNCFDYSGGPICDWGAHHLDVAQWYMGKSLTGPVEITGKGEFPTEGIWNTALQYEVEYLYADGLRVVAGSRLPDFGPKFFGEDGKWLHVNRETLQSNPPQLLKAAVQSDDMRELWVSGSHLGSFLDCVKTRRQTVAPVEIGHRSISLAHLGNISMRLDKKIKWDPDKEQFVNDPEAERLYGRAMRYPWRL